MANYLRWTRKSVVWNGFEHTTDRAASSTWRRSHITTMCVLSTLKKVPRFQNQLAHTQIEENAGTQLKKELSQDEVKNFVLWVDINILESREGCANKPRSPEASMLLDFSFDGHLPNFSVLLEDNEKQLTDHNNSDFQINTTQHENVSTTARKTDITDI
ncbi:hypothetical protein PoB_006271700 [Plakobranchus ocellatus]|uniref:Uncharacterized protein n=1 Tax=Plakobranchus ocellatus TaxID=259542 RepID=A0AAV4CWD4_9GAST|nr:hypothetical protein PoB_006271700 [Plakobranchus ocellatus]